MNKTEMIGIIKKRTTQLTVLSVVFVGLMMVFLVPSLVEEAQARIDATAISFAGSFSTIKGEMSDGHFVTNPHTVVSTNIIEWRLGGKRDI